MQEVYKKALKSDFARRNFLGVADYEYISARTLFRNECFDQFLTLSHQAIEKYLKAILLFNNRDTRFGHDLEKGLEDVKLINEVELNESTVLFIKEIDHVKFARYLTGCFYGSSDFLLSLDATVWDLRLFCQNLKNPNFKLEKAKSKENIFNATIKGYPVIFSGELEKILKNDKGKYQKIRENLVWKNFRYGKRKKYKIKNFSSRMWSKNPTFLINGSKEKNKECYNYLKRYVSFEKEVRNYFNELS